MSIFQSGFWATGFDMDPAAASIFTQNAAGSGDNSLTPYSFGYSWSCGNNVCGILLNTNLTTIIAGFWFHVAALPSNGIFCSIYDATAGATQVSFRVNATGQIQCYLGSGTGTPIGSASSAGTIVASTWTYIEVKVHVAGSSAGSVECRVNGSTVITQSSVTTQSTANAFTNAFQIQGANNPCHFDDLYLLDTTGSSPFNTYLGPTQVREEAPNANSAVGGRNAWTPTSPTGSNYQNVGTTPASASKYNADNTPGDYDMFRFPSLPSNVNTVLACNVVALLLLDSSGARTVELNTYSNGTDNPTSAFTPAITATYYTQANTVDPHTSSAWTPSNAGAAELGVKVQS